MKYAVITGGTKGIGEAIAELLLEKGYFVIVNYSSDVESARDFEKANERYFDRLKIIKQELSCYDDVERFVLQIRRISSNITALILNVGVTDRTGIYEISPKSWEYVMNTNVNVPFYMIQKLGLSIEDNVGRIIFIGSVCGQLPHSVSVSYGVSKAAVHQMSKELVKFFSPRGITVNTVVPGFIDTPRQKVKTQEQRGRIEQKTALKRFGEPEEVASLCYEVINNSYINGACLNIDGGYCFE